MRPHRAVLREKHVIGDQLDEISLLHGCLPEMLRVSAALAAKGITPLALGDNGIWAAVHLLENVRIARPR